MMYRMEYHDRINKTLNRSIATRFTLKEKLSLKYLNSEAFRTQPKHADSQLERRVLTRYRAYRCSR
jgi:hypothetical protein